MGRGGYQSPETSTQIETATSPARTATALLANPASASTPNERAMVCADILVSGKWTLATTKELAALWHVDITAIGNYRRTGQAIRDAQAFDFGEALEHSTASFRRLQETNEAREKECKDAGDFANGARFAALALQALTKYAETSGALQQRVTISLEADPRISGLIRAIYAALDARDRREAEREEQLATWVGEVAKLTGGVLPAGRPEALPLVRREVVAAVHRYEADVGARRPEKG